MSGLRCGDCLLPWICDSTETLSFMTQGANSIWQKSNIIFGRYHLIDIIHFVLVFIIEYDSFLFGRLRHLLLSLQQVGRGCTQVLDRSSSPAFGGFGCFRRGAGDSGARRPAGGWFGASSLFAAFFAARGHVAASGSCWWAFWGTLFRWTRMMTATTTC